MQNTFTPIISNRDSERGDCASPIVLTVTWIWIVLVTFGRNLTVMVLSTMDAQFPAWVRLLYPLAEGILLGLPLLPLSIWWPNRRYRIVYQALLAAAGFVLLMEPVQIVHPYAAQSQAVLHILLCLVFIVLVLFFTRYKASAQEQGAPSQFTLVLVSVGMAALFAYPWLAWGALGSLLDTLLELLAGLSFGAAASLLVYRLFVLPLYNSAGGSGWSNLLAIVATGLVLLILASGLGFGFGVMQLLLMICLPPLSLALIGFLRRRSLGRGWQAWLPGALLVGLSAAAPMALIDPDELFLLISASTGEILQWAFYAALVSFFLSWLLGAFILLASRAQRPPDLPESQVLGQRPRRQNPAAWLLAVLPIVVGLLIYFFIGQPGFYGEGLFVILKDQADVTQGAKNIQDLNQRREYVYRTLVDKANTSQTRLRQTLASLHIAYTPYYLENAIEVQGGPLLRLWLETQPEVDRVLDNPWMRPLPAPLPTNKGTDAAPTQIEWNLTLINADKVWNELGVTGKGVVVGQSDTGVQWDHPELKADYRGLDPVTGQLNNDYNWFDPWSGSRQPFDIEGHGTHTLGSILGQHTGVAPGASWYACVNLERNLGNPSFYLDCMQFMLAPIPLGGDPLKDGDPRRGANVINNSWGCPDMEGCDPNSLHPAVLALKAAGVFVVASAGNDGPTCETLKDPLPIYPEVFSVGAINQAGQLSTFSSLGPVTIDGSNRIKPDIVAPGENVISSFPGNTYTELSGTSMAGPHVVGVVALMWSANPKLIGDIDRTTAILEQTARPYSGSIPNCPDARNRPSSAVGYGIVDAYAAVKMALQAK